MPSNSLPPTRLMSKRKRDSEIVGDDGDRMDSAKAVRVHHKLEQSTVKLGRAFKVAKGFERQKLGKRKKMAAMQNNDEDVQRMDGEIAALKALDHVACARSHLYKSLQRIRLVAEHDDLPAAVKQMVRLSSDTAVLNVHARLCNSHPVKDALPAVIDNIRSSLGVAEGTGKKKRVRATDFRDNNAAKAPQKSDGTSATDGLQPNVAHPLAHDDGEDSGALEPKIPLQDEFPCFDDRNTSSHEDSDDDVDEEGLERHLEAVGIAQKRSRAPYTSYDHQVDLSLSADDQNAGISSPEPHHAPAPGKLSFLPSLTMGGYISGSGSDIDDDIDVAPKKNRRGQRARQQMWEQRYGTKAKHLQKQKQGRNDGWDPKRGAIDDRGRHGRGKSAGGGSKHEHQPMDGIPKSENATPATQQSKRHRDDSGLIHPSWEAAKKAKEKRDAPVAFQGKKVKFD